MGAERGLLIGVGTLGSLGAVLAITPPQFGTSASGGLSGGAATPASTGTTASAAPAAASTTTPAAAAPAAVAATPAPAATTATKKKSTKKTTTKSSTATTSGNATASTPAATATTAAPAPAATKAAASSGASGTYTGGVYQAVEPNGRVWGNVQVTVTLNNGVISAISGVQSPSSRGGYAFSQMDPYVQAHKISISTITSTSAGSLPYVSQATYSSMAYWESLQSALKKAGL